MNLKSAKIAIPTYKKFLFGGGGLFAAAECAFLLFFSSYITQLKIPLGAVIPIVIIAIALPCFIMPLVYAIINGSTVISTGRYHLPLVICSLLACLFNVLLFSLHYAQGGLVGFLLFIYLFALSLTFQVYFYVYCSIGTRMDSSEKIDKFKMFFTFIGIIITAALALWFNDGSVQSISQVAYITSTIMVVSLMLIYFSSYSAMPFFIRLEPASNYTLKQNYIRYIAPLKFSQSRRALIAVFLMSAADILGIMCLLFFGVALGETNGFLLCVGFAIIVAVITVCLPILKNLLKKNSNAWIVAFGILAALITCALAIVFITFIFINAQSVARSIALYLACALYGVVTSILLSTQKSLHTVIKNNSTASFGNVYSLMCAVMILGLSLSAGLVVSGLLVSKFIQSSYVAVVLICIVAIIMVSAAVALSFSLKDSEVK